MTGGAYTERKVAEFWKWLEKNGVVEQGKTPFRIAEVPEGLGLIATAQINERDELFAIPESLLLSVSAAQASPVRKHLADLPAWIALALFLLHEKAKPESRWRPYLDLLPEELDSPFFWEDDDLKELEGTQLLGNVLSYRSFIERTFEESVRPILESQPQLWPQSVATSDAFSWAFGIVRSRTHPALAGDDIALVPLADLINHGNGPYVGASNQDFWAKKTQITMDYGAEKSNGDLALDYGFVVDGGIGEGTRDKFQLTLEVPEEDRFVDDKLDVAELYGLGQVCEFSLERGLDPSSQLLAFIRLIALAGADAFLLEAIFRDAVLEHVCLPVSRENEESVCASMIDGLRSSLSNYETTIEEDVRLLGDIDGDDRATRRKRMAVSARLAEKRVLIEGLDFFETRLKDLDRLEYYAERRLKSLGLLDDSGDVTPWDEFQM
ncbi:hypothetical protein KFL_003310030 [Klebsormidium nitens]|uniref:Rubisco LSMT substrate-binding domain-containing protein n=1 Tax=Klebsormidium nitens TaxID=105231 RepID=A0A1Y1IDB0_KLENI|nr:hypothetical protein KFL_003310030 [Klebsormidium nitens]|eukprot:GAQ87091.1 hypothetical protein KFL_003310030 [Klebsormidium nitens]